MIKTVKPICNHCGNPLNNASPSLSVTKPTKTASSSPIRVKLSFRETPSSMAAYRLSCATRFRPTAVKSTLPSNPVNSWKNACWICSRPDHSHGLNSNTRGFKSGLRASRIKFLTEVFPTPHGPYSAITKLSWPVQPRMALANAFANRVRPKRSSLSVLMGRSALRYECSSPGFMVCSLLVAGLRAHHTQPSSGLLVHL
jgi:hypothetical protein